MAWAFSIFGWLAGLLILGLIARLVAALFSEQSRHLVKTNPKRHLFWIVTVIVLWVLMSELPGYLTHKHLVEAKQKFIELMQHDLKADVRFASVGLDTNHSHFMSITGVVSSTEQMESLNNLVRSNRTIFYAPAVMEVTVHTNFDK